MKVLCLGLVLLCVNLCSLTVDGATELMTRAKPEKQFEDFMVKYEKEYKDENEKSKRFEVFKKNLKEIKRLNSRPRRGSVVYGITKFADLTQNEFLSRHTTKNMTFAKPPVGDHYFSDFSVSETNFNWATNGAVTPVQDEGECPASYAYSAVAVIETFHFKLTKKLSKLSEQELIDCGTSGCHSGFPADAFQTVLDLKGIKSQAAYNEDKENCTVGANVQARLTAIETVNHDETGMKNFVYNKGPIAVAINAADMQFYVKGVSVADASVCSPSKPNRFVTLVGYGRERYGQESLPFWIAKNSFGKNWGEEGYYRFHRGSNYCGVKTHPSSVMFDESFTGNEDPITTQAPVTTAEPITTQGPTTATPKTTEHPHSTTHKPKTTSQPITTQGPTTATPKTTQHPHSTTHKPKTTFQPITTEGPTTATPKTTEHPHSTTRKPKTTTQEITTQEQTTATQTQHPHSTTRKPNTTSQPITTEGPTTATPKTTKYPHSTTRKPKTTSQPITTQGPTTATPITTQHPHSTTRKPKTTSQPITTQEQTTATPKTTQHPHSTTRKPKTTSQPITTEGPTTATPKTTKYPHSTTHKPKTTTQPITTEGPTTATPKTTQHQHSTTRKPKTTSQPITTEGPTTATPKPTEHPHSTTRKPKTTTQEITTQGPTTPTPKTTKHPHTTTRKPKTTTEPITQGTTTVTPKTTKHPHTTTHKPKTTTESPIIKTTVKPTYPPPPPNNGTIIIPVPPDGQCLIICGYHINMVSKSEIHRKGLYNNQSTVLPIPPTTQATFTRATRKLELKGETLEKKPWKTDAKKVEPANDNDYEDNKEIAFYD